MDVRTVMLILAVGSFVFGLLLTIFKYSKNNPQTVPFWITAKMLQAAGSLMLYFRTSSFDALTILANTTLILACAYEAWTVRFLMGHNVKRRLHIITTAAILLVCSLTLLIDSPYRTGLFFGIQSAFYFLPSMFLTGKSNTRFWMRMILAASYFVTGLVFLISAIICLFYPEDAINLSNSAIASLIPGTSFCIFLLSALILLMIAKERSDMQLHKIQKELMKSEIRFQQIVETANEGILIFDEHFKISFANNNMASILGYTVDEMLGRSYCSFFPEEQLDICLKQEAKRKNGEDSVYECRLLRKDGHCHWFLVSAKAIMDESGKFKGSFAMLTDINARKEMELLLEESNRQLTELSNKDSLTGIANRRCFDATLEHEYLRLSRSNSKLSIILIDIDYFKEYNDYYGHVKGDECLRQIGSVLADCINRSVDLAARYGGEEFVCILPDTDIQSAVETAERIRQKIQDLKIEHKKSQVSDYVTASFGVITVEYSPDRSLAEIIAAADKLLYKAKVSGRNRIEYGESIGA